MTNPSNSAVQNLLPVQAYFNLDGSFNTFIGQGVPFYATANPVQSGLTITNSTLNSSPIGSTSPSTGVFTNISTTTGTVSTTPTGTLDLANKGYVDAVAQGLSFKQPAIVRTIGNITLSGLQTIDGVTVAAGDRVLVIAQTSTPTNGIYLASAGAWSRAPDADTYAEYLAAYLFVLQGTLWAGSAWVCTNQPGGTLGVTPITFIQFSNNAIYTAGTGLTLTGFTFSITNTGVSAATYGSATTSAVLAINAQGQVTSASNSTITPAVGSITGLGTGVATWLATPTSANLAAAVTDETGTGALVFANGPTLIAPALGTPASGVVTNLTGTASININGSVGATTPNTGAFTTISTSSTTNTTPVLSFNASNSAYSAGATIANSYLQFLMQNKSGTAGASTNYVISNDLGTDSTYYGEFGMNSSAFSASTPADFFSINNGIYFSGHDGDLSIGSGNGFKTYFAWGSVGQSAHVINASGAIGLNTNLGTTPANSGTSGFGTSGQVLTSQGSSAAPIWSTPAANVSSFSAGTTGLTPSTATTGAVTLAGTLNVANGGTGITAFGTGVATALGQNVTGSGSIVLSTSPTLVTPALGTPASGVVTNLTGTASININGTVGATTATTGAFTTVSATGVITSTVATGTAPFTVSSTTAVANLSIGGTAATATNATNIAITDDTTTATAVYPTWVTTTTGNLPQKTSSTKLTFVPSTGTLTTTTFSGALSGNASTATSATTATNLAGGAANQVPYQTGSGATSFVSAPGTNGYVLTWNGTNIVWAAGGTSPIPAGTVTNFIQAAAPTGWTQVTTWNNYAFRVVSGTGGGTGGTVAFTTAFASQTPSGTVSTSISAVSGSVGISGGSVGSYTLATADIPSHTHSSPSINVSLGCGGATIVSNAACSAGTALVSNATGGGGSHTHSFTAPTGSFTFSSGTASSSFSGTAINLAVQYVDNIIASKN